MPDRPGPHALTGVPWRLFHQNLSFLRDYRLDRMLKLAGHELRFGLPGNEPDWQRLSSVLNQWKPA